MEYASLEDLRRALAAETPASRVAMGNRDTGRIEYRRPSLLSKDEANAAGECAR
jgi:hypothetical protein